MIKKRTIRMVDGDSRFPEFEKYLSKNENRISYPEDLPYSTELAAGLLSVSSGVTLFVISYSTASLVKYIGLFLVLSGIALCLIGFAKIRKKIRECGFRGLSRTTISKTIMYLDSIIVQPDELESPAPYHEASSLSSSEKSLAFDEVVNFIKQTSDIITWPLDFIIDTQRHSKWLKRRMILLVISAIVLSLGIGFGTYSALTSESAIIAFLGITLFYLFLVTLYCIFQSVYIYVRIPVLKKTVDLNTSKMQKLEETLNEIFTLLQSDYSNPLRFYLVREYPQLVYTGRTKTSYALVRLKEAVFYPEVSVGNN